MSGFPTLFERITKAGGLPKDVTPHILRHSFASLAADGRSRHQDVAPVSNLYPHIQLRVITAAVVVPVKLRPLIL